MISIKHLRKTYGDIIAVDDVSIELKKGEVFSLLGPNGAGKTTTIKAILGLIQYDGEIKIDDMHVKENEKVIKKIIGYLPEKVSFYDNLTALQTLQFFAELKDLHDVDFNEILKQVGLGNDGNRKVGGFSKGMLQRLGMAQCLLGNSKLLILDEPTTGLDALGAFELRKKIKELNKAGITILLCSHILSEVQELSHRVAILNKGKLLAVDTVENLRKKLDIQPKLIIELKQPIEGIVQTIKKIPSVKNAAQDGNSLDVICKPEAKLAVMNALEKAGADIVDFKTIEPSLEEVFVKMVNDNA